MELANHLALEFDHTVYDSVQSRVSTYAYIFTWVKFGAALLYDDLTFANSLITEYFNAEPF